jgi:hypothetical protein
MTAKISKKYERDYRDICYFIKHVKDVDLRIDLIRSLGYKIGVNVVKKGIDDEAAITLGKRKEYRIQISPTSDKIPIAACAIVGGLS